MTSRLKRKLENLGFDTSSGNSKLTENFCLIGTPLPALEKAKDAGEFQPIWKQEVRDEKGRRRLHGAFTGGFSAGYFNTVGSKEGWTPSTFVSSRSSRASQKAARPEDFMDEEDLAEIRESQKLVDTTEESDLFATRSVATAPEDDSIAGALSNLIPPVNDSAGARLLQKMGWRPGQGVGPRVTYAKLKLQDRQSSSLPADSKPLPDDADEEASRHLFAPRDIKVIQYRPKDNSHGLGYTSGPSLRNPLDSRKQGMQGPNISAGFGLGALNDADEDDIDVYESGLSKAPRRHLAYDADSDEERPFTLGNQSARSKKSGQQSAGKFRDGRAPPAGFVVAAKPEIEDKWFPLPEIPKGWKAGPQRVWEAAAKLQGQENIPPGGTPQVTPKGAAKTADERGAILGEARLPAAPRSVFEYLSEKDRERLKAFSNKAKDSQSLPASVTGDTRQQQQQLPSQPEVITMPTLHPSVAKAALQGFQPFVNDPPKQARYTAFLNYAASPGSHPPLSRQAGQSPEDFFKELSDFSKSAMIFKPATGAMASRFTSAVVVEGGAKVVEGLHQPSTNDSYLTIPNADEEAKKAKELEEKESQDPKKNAAKLEMFGPLTRETKSWQPDKLLCKRFGVKDPYPGGLSVDPNEDESVAVPGQTAASGSTQAPLPLTQTETSVSTGTSTAAAAAEPPPSNAPGRRDLANIGLGEDETQGTDILTYQRPSRDIFKAIFASDDEDSDTDEMDVDVKEAPSLAPAEQVQKPKEASKDDDKPVDLATFKPTFVSRSDRQSKGKDEKDKQKDKKDKKKKAKAIVSFQEGDGDDDGALSIRPTKEKDKKKRRRDKEDGDKEKDEKKVRKTETSAAETDDDGVWVEKAAPVVAAPSRVEQPHSGRMRASDFM
ncbi:hypothetical protein FRC03_007527 [Tulasnella sp. 419]|nr:hypothetical protein FRC03_007527 [Tulasnella sp. 419]